jgi:hypothetical protein
LNFSVQSLVEVPGFGFQGAERYTICDKFEGFAPEDNALLHVQTNALQEKRILQSALVLQVAVLAQLAVQILHAKREVRTQTVDAAGVDVGDIADSAVLVIRCVRCDERL